VTKKSLELSIYESMNKGTVIVVPVYKQEPTNNDLRSFKQCSLVLKNYPIFVIAPENLDLQAYRNVFSDFRLEIFDDHYFEDIAGYNKLMLSKSFYERFSKNEYLLIHQLDSLVFKDNLTYWVNKKYDYIGAPWMCFSFQVFFSVLLHVSLKDALKVITQNMLKNPVGNGGLSLRKIKSAMLAIDENQELISRWKANEDYFWSYFATNHGNPLKKPDKEEAVNFSIETNPKKAFKYLRSELPFGVHSWEKYDKNFWQHFFWKNQYKKILDQNSYSEKSLVEILIGAEIKEK
jgi:hypothetical protein